MFAQTLSLRRPPMVCHHKVRAVSREVSSVLPLLPRDMHRKLEDISDDLVELVMDVGRVPIARFADRDIPLREAVITYADLEASVRNIEDFDHRENRGGVAGTLHRISAVTNRAGAVIGLTCRVGRAVVGCSDRVREILASNKSVLLIGPPGSGKTSLLRDMSRSLADEYARRVIVVDASNELGGPGDIPHVSLGSARRLQVPPSKTQHAVMLEAVENHMPHVVVVDELGTREDVLACQSIARRGVRIVASVHGTCLEDIIDNPELRQAVGGITTVTLSDTEARMRGTTKTVRERMGPSPFDVALEIRRPGIYGVRDICQSVDAYLKKC